MQISWLHFLKSHVRPILDYCSSLRNVGYLGDSQLLESVQRRWTKQVTDLANVEYHERLQTLELFSIRGRLLRAELIKCWKAFQCSGDVNLISIFSLVAEVGTRGHHLKLSVPAFATELRRRFLSVRVVSTWNRLPIEIIDSTSLHTFKSRLSNILGDLLYR